MDYFKLPAIAQELGPRGSCQEDLPESRQSELLKPTP